MLQFWIEVSYIPEYVTATTNAIKIYIPNFCPTCNFKIELNYSGNEEQNSTLSDSCAHTEGYHQLWKMRIQANHDPLNDGCKCEKCTEWVPMAIPNLPDNKFKCYRCRTHPLSI